MELTAALPAELAALADPAPRRAAALPAQPGAGPPGAVVFELVLGLLQGAEPGGELRPPGGRDLPLAESITGLVPAVAAADAAAAAVGTPPAVAPVGLATALDEAAAEARVPVARPPPLGTPVGALVPGAAPAGSEGTEARAAAPVPLVAAAAEADPGAFELGLRPSADPPRAHEQQGLEALLANDARQRALLGDGAPRDFHGRAQTAPPPGPAPAPVLQGAAREAPAPLPQAPPPLPMQHRAPRSERLAALAPLAPAAAATAPPDWLPAASAHAATATQGTATAPAPAAPGAPVDTLAPEWREAFAQRVQWVVDTKAGAAEIRLHPPELGSVNVKISLVDDKTHVHLVVSTAAARDEFAQSLPRLRDLFAAGGLELGSATVLDARGEHSSRGSDARHGHGSAPGHAAIRLEELAGETVAVPRRPASGRIDVFA